MRHWVSAAFDVDDGVTPALVRHVFVVMNATWLGSLLMLAGLSRTVSCAPICLIPVFTTIMMTSRVRGVPTIRERSSCLASCLALLLEVWLSVSCALMVLHLNGEESVPASTVFLSLIVPLSAAALFLFGLTARALPELVCCVDRYGMSDVVVPPCDMDRFFKISSLFACWLGLLSIMFGVLALYMKLVGNQPAISDIPYVGIVPGLILGGGSFGLTCSAWLRYKRVQGRRPTVIPQTSFT